MIVEAPDHGHETTSEAFSFWIWLEAQYGRVTENWAPFNNAWTVMERYIIPSHNDQPTAGAQRHTAVRGRVQPAQPVPVAAAAERARRARTRCARELQSTYGTGDIYGMHWLLDVDNTYGFGRCGDGTTRPAYINTFQRGPQESVWETVPQPSCETFNFGGPDGFLDLSIKESSAPAKQWKYTNAPDADARAIEAAYWALTWATEQGRAADVSATVAKAAKMGDYLRYAMFDKYFKKIGNCVGASACPAGSGKDSAHYLMSWYYAWGGATDPNAGWSWRIGSQPQPLRLPEPDGGVGADQRQRAQAALAVGGRRTGTRASTGSSSSTSGCSRPRAASPAGRRTAGTARTDASRSAGTPTFYGMFYDVDPVYHDPPSNQWFGMQVWSMHRIAELYYATGNAKAKALLDKWVPWAIANTTIGTGGAFEIPSDMTWSGAPTTWNPSSPAANTGLHVTVTKKGRDVGVAAAYARTLMYYAARAEQRRREDGGQGPDRRSLREQRRAWCRDARDPRGLPAVRRRLQRQHRAGPVPATGLDGRHAQR